MSKSDLAISVKNVSKQYVIAHEEKHCTLAEAWLDRAKHPFRKAPREIFEALKDVNFEIKKGDVLGIIGRNGAGKSTLLKILSRITEPTQGQIDLYGRVGSLLEVGTGFHPELTGRENIFLNGAILGMKRKEIERQFDAIVAFAEIEKFLDTPVKRYSSGMYVRLAFAVAAHLNPEILIVDEVLAVGDVAFQKKCLGKMKEVSEGEGRTVLFVSHNLGAVATLCNRAVLMHKGRVVDTGLTDEVITKYVDPKNGIFSSVGSAHLLKDVGSFRLNRIEAWQHDNCTAVVDCQFPFEIRISYELVQREPTARTFLSFRSPTGEVVLVTSDMDGRHGVYPERDRGCYEACIQVPGGLLKCGTLFCTWGADIKRDRVLTLAEDVLRLDVVDSDVESESERHHRQTGLVPLFTWDIKKSPA